MTTKHGLLGAAAGFLFSTVIATTAADAKPLKVCFKTADGKHYLERGAGGHLRAVARRCKNNAVFLVRDAKNPERTPTFGKAVTLYAAKTERYVWTHMKKKAAFASRRKVNMRDRRFFFQINRVAGGDGAPLSAGARVSMRSFVRSIPAFVPDGGGNSLIFGEPPKNKTDWGAFTIVNADKR